MLKDRKELEKYLSNKFMQIFQHKLDKNVYNYANEQYSIPKGLVSDLITERISLQEASEFVLFILCDSINSSLYELGGNRRLTDISMFYTETEINYYLKQKYKEEAIEFPLVFKMVQIEDDQWIGKIDVQTLIKLRKAQIIKYNINTQRVMKKKVKGEKVVWKIAIIKKSINEIADAFKKRVFIPNTITLNIPYESEADYYYNENTCEFIVKSIDCFDITDGYHRFLGAANVADLDPAFNYNMELRITAFSEDKAISFIGQEDKKNHMKKIDSESMDMNKECNMVVRSINEDARFYFKGMISRNDGIIPYAELSSLVDYFYFKNSKKEDRRRTIIIAAKEIINNFNLLAENNPSYLEKRMDYNMLLAIMFCFDYYKKNNLDISNICEIIESLKTKIIETGAFKGRKLNTSLMNRLEKIIQEVM